MNIEERLSKIQDLASSGLSHLFDSHIDDSAKIAHSSSYFTDILNQIDEIIEKSLDVDKKERLV
jgi:hypothetical protein